MAELGFHRMNLASKLYLCFGTALVAGCWVLALTGFSLSAPPSEVAPVSVRENPASFRPSYSTWTGWHPIPIPVSGGGGGFGFGK